MTDTQEKPQEKAPVFINGVKVQPFMPLDISPEQHIRELIAMEIRDDDILVAAFPKCGTHWLWEVIQMLVNRTTAHEERAKEMAMMEFTRVQNLNAQPSPRILNSHLPMAHLPEDMLKKKTKIIHVVRNPKDVMVSMFYHYKVMFPLTWDVLFEDRLSKDGSPSIPKGRLPKQFDFLKQMHDFQLKHPDQPVKTVYYEDVKKEPVRIVRELAEFLQVPNKEDFYQAVVDACSFDALKKADKNKKFPQMPPKLAGKEKPQFYRKGVIGDWKNHFTVAQNEQMDAFIERELKGLPYTFLYE